MSRIIKNQKKAEEPALSGSQWTALLTLAGGGLKGEAAKQAGVHAQTVSAWMKQDEFRATLNSMRSQSAELVHAQMQPLLNEALTSIRDTVNSGPPPLRLKAAMYV